MVELEFTVTKLNGIGKLNEEGTTWRWERVQSFLQKPEVQWDKSRTVAVVSEKKDKTAEMTDVIKWQYLLVWACEMQSGMTQISSSENTLGGMVKIIWRRTRTLCTCKEDHAGKQVLQILQLLLFV